MRPVLYFPIYLISVLYSQWPMGPLVGHLENFPCRLGNPPLWERKPCSSSSQHLSMWMWHFAAWL